jgi:hypothetical protein
MTEIVRLSLYRAPRPAAPTDGPWRPLPRPRAASWREQSPPCGRRPGRGARSRKRPEKEERRSRSGSFRISSALPRSLRYRSCRLFICFASRGRIFATGRQCLEYCTTFKYSNATKSAGFLDMPKLCSLWFLYLTDLLVESCATV